MGRVLNDIFDDSDPTDLHKKILIPLLYYGMMRINKENILKKKDIRLDTTEDINVNFPYTTTRSTKGYSFKIPSWIKPSFALYLQ